MRCPCRPVSESRAYLRCCGSFHVGDAIPPTAAALMRSRFAAYALQSADYLRATWHPSTRPTDLTFDDGVTWLSLKIDGTQEDGDAATVTFTARFRDRGKLSALRETSRFVREDARWFYVDGVIAP